MVPGRLPRLVLEPLVLGPDAIPIITGKQEARRTPELAVLSAMAHGRQVVAWAVARAAFHGTRDLEAERRCLYMDLVVSSLNGAARTALEELMGSGNYDPVDPKKHGARWMLGNDLRGYILLGDPAVRLRAR